MEAHGGYAFCAIAALEILGETHLLDMPKFIVSLSHNTTTIFDLSY